MTATRCRTLLMTASAPASPCPAFFSSAIACLRAKPTAIDNMHVSWSKKPHTAIRQYIRHDTSPGDMVRDRFCGSGGTALAALLDGRKAIAIDRSPAATFMARESHWNRKRE